MPPHYTEVAYSDNCDPPGAEEPGQSYQEAQPEGQVLGGQLGLATNEAPNKNEDQLYASHALLPNLIPL